MAKGLYLLPWLKALLLHRAFRLLRTGSALLHSSHQQTLSTTCIVIKLESSDYTTPCSRLYDLEPAVGIVTVCFNDVPNKMLCRFRNEGIYFENIDIRIVINFIEKNSLSSAMCNLNQALLRIISSTGESPGPAAADYHFNHWVHYFSPDYFYTSRLVCRTQLNRRQLY